MSFLTDFQEYTDSRRSEIVLQYADASVLSQQHLRF